MFNKHILAEFPIVDIIKIIEVHMPAIGRNRTTDFQNICELILLIWL
jgi:hypothetical protein